MNPPSNISPYLSALLNQTVEFLEAGDWISANDILNKLEAQGLRDGIRCFYSAWAWHLAGNDLKAVDEIRALENDPPLGIEPTVLAKLKKSLIGTFE